MAGQGSDNNSRQQVAIGITSALLSLTTLVVCLRLYIRCVRKAGLPGWDDLTVFVAWLMALGASITTYVEISSGLGQHMEQQSSDQLHRFNLCRFVGIQLYIVGLSFVKISFAAQFYRAFADRTIRRICMCLAFYCSLWMVVQSVLYSFSCIPIQYLLSDMSDVCIPSAGTWSAIAIVNVLTDAFIFYIPLKPLRQMSLRRVEKCLLISIFCFGFGVCVISVARLPTLRHAASSLDQTLTYHTTALLSLAELETAIVCTSLPVLMPMIARIMRGVSPRDDGSSRIRAGAGDEAGHSGKNKRGPSYREEPLYNANLSGSTMTSRSFFRTFALRDEDMGDEQPVFRVVAGTMSVGPNGGYGGEKSLTPTKIREVKHHKRDEKKSFDAPIDFFHCPSLKKVIQRPQPIVPRDLRKGTSQEPLWKAPKPSSTFTYSSPQSSPVKIMPTPMSPLSAHFSGTETNGPSSARTSNSFFRTSHHQGDEFCSHGGFNHTCNLNTDSSARELCSTRSSELLPERLRSVGQPPPELPQLPPFPPRVDQAKVADTQTPSATKQKPGSTDHGASDAMVTQSTQMAIAWESSRDSDPESSRSTSRQSSEESRVEVEVARQGTITRARERAMQAMAEKTSSQVGEVHQGRARVVQVDTSQRRQAAIGVEEVMGLDADLSPCHLAGPLRSSKGVIEVSDRRLSRPTQTSTSSRAQTMEPELTPSQQQEERSRNESDAEETVLTSEISPSQEGDDARDQAGHSPPTNRKRAAAATSWLRLSTDLSL